MRAHPRSRGENYATKRNPTRPSGSSPLTRGKHLVANGVHLRFRLIPAHAGKTKRSDHTDPGPAAHPRSRGENEIARAEDVNSNGSSPLTRGKPAPDRRGTRTPRLIPAHAGKTFLVVGSEIQAGAHPRSRGENGSEAGDEKGSTGSSPLTRGKRRLRRGRAQRHGLIPAHAGKTLPDLRFYCADRSDLGNP